MSRDAYPTLLPVVGLGLFLSVLYWPIWPLVPAAGLDESWRSGLTWAHQLGLNWGTDVVFTFGPLYYLDFPMANSRPGLLAASFLWLGYALLLTGIVHGALGLARPGWSPNVRLLATGLASALLLVMPTTSGFLNLHVLVPIALLVTITAAAFRIPWLAWLVGALLGVVLLHKLSDAAVVGAVAIVVVPTALGVAGAIRMAIGGGLAFVLSWILAGQALGDIPGYVSGSAEIVRGFAAAMSTQMFNFLWQYPLAILLGLICLWATNRLARARGLTRVARLGLVFGVALGLWVAGHQAFTRHDGHYWYFFGVLVILSVIFTIVSTDRATIRASVITAVAAYLVVVTIYMPLMSPLDRQPSISAAATALGVLSSHEYAAELFDGATRSMAESYGITPELRAAIGSTPTLADPWDISALLAVNAAWDPLPVIQQYAAFTPALDALNAASLSARARQILRSVPYPSIDGRNPTWESPRYQRIVYCSYEVILGTPSWQLLAPSVSTRCAAQVAGPEADATRDEPVPVPQRPGSITLVTISPMRSIVESVIDFAAKPFPTYVSYGDQRWRLAQNPEAVELMLNGPAPHPSFAYLPTMPHPTISVSRPAHLEFSFVETNPGDRPLVTVGTDPAKATGTLPLAPIGAAGSIIVGTNDLETTAAGNCVQLMPTGDDPHIVLAAGDGLIVELMTPPGGDAQLFIAPGVEFLEESSFHVTLDPGSPTRVDLSDQRGFIRIDPPSDGTSTLCASRP